MLSVVIPTLNAQGELSRLLSQLVGTVDEVIVSDGGSTDNTLNVAHAAKTRMALGCKGRGWQLARGAMWASRQNTDDWLLFIHADTVLAQGWHEQIIAHINEYPNHAGVFKFKFDQSGFWPKYIEIWVALRSTLFALPYGDQGLLIRRDLYQSIGGFADIPLFEDVDIIRRLGRTHIKRIPVAFITSAWRYRKNGFVRRGLSNIVLLLRYLFGASPASLAKKYNQ